MKVLSVSEYLKLVNETLALIPANEVVIEGEVSDFRVSQGKWVSFDLKDEHEDAVLKCFSTVWKIKTPLEDGLRVRAVGYSKVYERFGSMKLNVEAVEPVGEGAIRRAYELLKKKLEDEGLFSTERKRSIPRFPSKIGVITSREAAAYTDFIRIANNRWGGVTIQLAPVHVQGKNAVSEILGAFSHFNSLPKKDRPDAIVLTRGGGGLEDLHAFNDEAVARAVFGSAVPVVCGVGHERDESLCDFVADIRASTPSNAAEIVFPDRASVLYEIDSHKDLFATRLEHVLDERRAVIRNSAHAMSVFFERVRGLCRDLTGRLIRGFDHELENMRGSIVQFERVLTAVDPKRVLSRGYSIVKAGNKLVKDATTLELGANVNVQLAHGGFNAEVTKIETT